LRSAAVPGRSDSRRTVDGWQFPDKMRGLAGGPPKGWSVKTPPKDLMPEDYITCLAEDDVGVVWVDFRQHGMLAVCG